MRKLIFFSIVFLFSCKVYQSQDTAILFVNSYKVACSSVNKQLCFEIRQTNSEDWHLLYQSIEGFEYEEGYIYQLEVEKVELPMELTPADASTLHYKLIKVVSKNKDPSLVLNDIWVITKIGGVEIVKELYKELPKLEIILRERKIRGFDGCNNFFGNLEVVDDQRLEMQIVGSTRAYCPELKDSGMIGKHIASTRSYEIDSLNLILFDEDGKEILHFRKVD